MLKQEAEQVDAENTESKVGKLNHVNPDMVARLSEALKEDWQKLASKLGYTNDEVIIRDVLNRIFHSFPQIFQIFFS